MISDCPASAMNFFHNRGALSEGFLAAMMIQMFTSRGITTGEILPGMGDDSTFGGVYYHVIQRRPGFDWISLLRASNDISGRDCCTLFFLGRIIAHYQCLVFVMAGIDYLLGV
ncbi:hypothetical protein HGRIS_014210 [Hohenbuehelia grisea]|uniref:Uncharacterized protein n=1 Tax=Hohenbuehelia grisea TaxID=104357 RepID=A0ABR3JSW0_9AGAR